MSTDTIILTIILTLISLIVLVPIVLFLYLWNIDHRQQEHSILRNFPVLGKVRYILEKVGPELRQPRTSTDRGERLRHQRGRLAHSNHYGWRLRQGPSECG